MREKSFKKSLQAAVKEMVQGERDKIVQEVLAEIAGTSAPKAKSRRKYKKRGAKAQKRTAKKRARKTKLALVEAPKATKTPTKKAKRGSGKASKGSVVKLVRRKPENAQAA